MNKWPSVLSTSCVVTLILGIQAITPRPATASDYRYTVKRTAEAINVDGRLDEEAWKQAPTVKLSGKNGGPAAQATTVRILWDNYYIYFSWECQDSNIWSTMTVRDQPLYNEEVVEVFLDPDGDGKTYVELEVNPLGTLWDGFILNREFKDGQAKLTGILTWNSLGLRWAVHNVGTVNDPSDKDQLWSVELALPLTDIFTAANNPPKDGDRWRANLFRIDMPEGAGKPAQGQAWSPVSGRTFHDPQRFGELVFSDETVQ